MSVKAPTSHHRNGRARLRNVRMCQAVYDESACVGNHSTVIHLLRQIRYISRCPLDTATGDQQCTLHLPTNESRLPTTRRNYLARRDSRRGVVRLDRIHSFARLKGFPPRCKWIFHVRMRSYHVALRVETHARSSANRAAAEARRAHSISPRRTIICPDRTCEEKELVERVPIRLRCTTRCEATTARQK